MQKHTVCTRYSNDQVSQLNSLVTRYIVSLFVCLFVCLLACSFVVLRLGRDYSVPFWSHFTIFTTFLRRINTTSKGYLRTSIPKRITMGFLISLVLCLTNTRINLKKMPKVNEWILMYRKNVSEKRLKYIRFLLLEFGTS